MMNMSYVNVRKFPWLDHIVVHQVIGKLKGMLLQAGVWDKEPCKLHATCSTHMAPGLAELTIVDANFRIVGLQRAPKGASKYVISETLR